ncbi:MAG: endonuclease III domain-containing protein [Terriglobales bacterium]
MAAPLKKRRKRAAIRDLQASAARLRRFYRALFRRWGPQHWWPAESRFEVIVGAYLTQNTAWTNVELALAQLRSASVLSLEGIRNIPLPELEKLVRSAGYFRQKAQRLKTFVEFVDRNYGGSLDRMFAEPTESLREKLPALNGVGPETADSILLYAGSHPSFVVDAYTRRILERHRLIASHATYNDIRQLFQTGLGGESFVRSCTASANDFSSGSRTRRDRPEGSCHDPSGASALPRSELAQVFNEMHGLLVGVGKNYCLKRAPKCEICPLKRDLPNGRVRLSGTNSA